MKSWVLSYLLNSLWQIPLLFAAGWVAARALRRVGSTAEHRVWVSVLLLQTLLPAFSMLPPGWLGSGGLTDVPKDACYRSNCGQKYVWVCSGGLAAPGAERERPAGMVSASATPASVA